MGGVQGDEERGIIVCAGVDVVEQVNLGAGVEVDLTLLITLAEDDTLAFLKVDILTVHFDQFAHADSRRNEDVYHGEVTGLDAGIAQDFEIFIGEHFFDERFGANLADAAHGAFLDEVFILKP